MDKHITTQTIPVSQARQKLGELINQVYKRQVRIVVEKSGIPVVALVALADFERWLHQEQAEEGVSQMPSSKEVTTMSKEEISSPLPTKDELAHRQALVANILAQAKRRVISPLTAADLVHQARRERAETYERWSH